MDHTIILKFSKSTKGTHVYEATPDGRPPVITSLYIQKWAIPGTPPEHMELSLKPAKPK